MKTEIIPVIHMLTEEQVNQNIKTCLNAGIEKVFLINHAVSESTLLQCASEAKETNPSLWLGVNLLGTLIENAVKLRLVTDGLWCDQTLTRQVAVRRSYKGLLFTGIAFKYQSQPTDLKTACEEAIKYTDVLTTSGDGTGMPATLEKILEIRKYIGDFPMAVASGVSVDNIEDYKGVVNYLLVASSITDKSELILLDKLRELKDKLGT